MFKHLVAAKVAAKVAKSRLEISVFPGTVLPKCAAFFREQYFQNKLEVLSPEK
jgi:hypothetical protein